jgi:hypothetical protein
MIDRPKAIDSFNNRLVFYQSSKSQVVQDHGECYTFKANSTIKEQAIYNIDGKVITEYNYRFLTNNLGLRMSAKQNDDMHNFENLAIGDSFTFGQGSTITWPDELNLSNHNSMTNFANGGIPGSGPQCWEWLLKHMRNEGFVPKNLIVGIIYDDLFRGKLTFDLRSRNCLENQALCEKSQIMQGFPKTSSENLQKTYKSIFERNSQRNPDESSFSKIRFYTSQSLPGTATIYRLLRYGFDSNSSIQKLIQDNYVKNIQSIDNIVSSVPLNNHLILLLPTKQEVSENIYNPLLIKAKQQFESDNRKVFDCLRYCSLDSGDFFSHDSHMKESGHRKVANALESYFRGMNR